jgi:hypothetical protein
VGHVAVGLLGLGLGRGLERADPDLSEATLGRGGQCGAESEDRVHASSVPYVEPLDTPIAQTVPSTSAERPQRAC